MLEVQKYGYEAEGKLLQKQKKLYKFLFGFYAFVSVLFFCLFALSIFNSSIFLTCILPFIPCVGGVWSCVYCIEEQKDNKHKIMENKAIIMIIEEEIQKLDKELYRREILEEANEKFNKKYNKLKSLLLAQKVETKEVQVIEEENQIENINDMTM